MSRVWIDISDDQNAKLRQLSKVTGFSRNDLIRLAIRDYLIQQLRSVGHADLAAVQEER